MPKAEFKFTEKDMERIENDTISTALHVTVDALEPLERETRRIARIETHISLRASAELSEVLWDLTCWDYLDQTR